MQLRGFDVRDSDTDATLTVKRIDVRGADPRNPAKCVISRACKRDMKVDEALVHLSRVYVRRRGENYWTRYQLPKALRTELVVYDRGGDAFQQEDVYDLRAPTKGNRLASSHRKEEVPSGPRVKAKPRPYHYTEGVRISAIEEY